MRILHFYKNAMPDSVGGVEEVIHQIAKGSVAAGLEVTVLSLSARGASTASVDGYTVKFARQDFEIASTGFSLSSIWLFARLAKQVDVIHYHFPWPFMDLVHFLTRVRKPTVVTYHSDIIRQAQLLKMYKPLQLRFLSHVDRIVATSPNYAKSSHVLQRFADKVSVIPIGIDKPGRPRPELLASWRERVGDRFFLFVGVLRYYKNLDVLLDASKGIDFPIVIVGRGPEEQALREKVRRLGLRNVHFTGYLPDEDKKALLALCYAIAFPSHMRSEAFGVSLLEGAANSKPLISCEIGTGTSYINVDGQTGLVIPPDDPLALRNAMTYLLDNPQQAAAMGAAAEKRFNALFTNQHMSDAYLALYRDLVQATG